MIGELSRKVYIDMLFNISMTTDKKTGVELNATAQEKLSTGLKENNDSLTNAEKFGEVVSYAIHGTRTKTTSLYFVVWESLANSDTFLCWADSEQDAVTKWGFSTKFVKHTVVKINPSSMPVVIGVSG